MSEPAAPSGDPAAVLFDIDGTLIDSNYLHVFAWSLALNDVGHRVDDWRIHASIGMDSSKLKDELLGADAERLGEAATDAHSARYADLTGELRPFAGARDLLAACAARGLRVVLATSAPEDELKKLREALDAEDSLHAVTSADDVETAKPEPDVVRVALERAGVDASRAVMVGDTVWDVEAAARAGVSCIGVLSGGIGAAALREAGAVAVYDDVAALLAGFDESPLAALL
ncbi:HAD family hydrolase [Subtercola boreus]|uniref:HAD family hydrolase n=1 Tax=Subtercola boreus TaxID=120213 RepID=A0A3E0VG38_9MICO|nr:HAD family hydrolase [Subtercola boreus]RFA08872.1 HAD family hydrolase [Subtercola boreus]TQL54152.1 HAD superfamily hydrolase (TIGR01509 family)/HAD superfamily hydrolase (TIGR01549 family) [Subtercola boreus]